MKEQKYTFPEFLPVQLAKIISFSSWIYLCDFGRVMGLLSQPESREDSLFVYSYDF